MAKILILNGPNLNLLGTREPEIYGSDTLADIEASCQSAAASLSLTIDFKQSNAEEDLINWIQAARTDTAGLIINAAAYTHTSVAIHDALKSLDIPIIELHISNPCAREEFRHNSYISPAATAILSGFGAKGYAMAIEAISEMI